MMGTENYDTNWSHHFGSFSIMKIDHLLSQKNVQTYGKYQNQALYKMTLEVVRSYLNIIQAWEVVPDGLNYLISIPMFGIRDLTGLTI